MIHNKSMRIAASIAAVALGLVPMSSTSSAPGTFNYPGAAPCKASLQKCIDAVPAGAKIRLKDDVPIAVDATGLTITKSLTLEPFPGDRPNLVGPSAGDPASLTVDGETASLDSIKVKIRGLGFKNFFVVARFDSGSGHRFSITDSQIRHKLPALDSNGLRLVGNAPATFVVRGNWVQSGGTGIKLESTAATTAFIEKNRVLGANSKNVAPAGGIAANVTGGSYLAVRNNLVYDVTDCDCGAAAISVAATASRVDIAGNTIDKATFGDGIQVSAASFADVDIFNNAVSRARRTLSLTTTTPDQVEHGHNNYYASELPNQYDDAGEGINDLFVAPKFYIDLSLAPGSPLINAGLTCNPAGGANPDLRGNARVWRTRVDIGAFEYGAPRQRSGRYLVGTEDGDLLKGTSGRDVLCGLEGNDVIDAKGGDDLVYAGAGRDRVYGGAGDDRFFLRDDERDRGNAGQGHDVCPADFADAIASCVMRFRAP